MTKNEHGRFNNDGHLISNCSFLVLNVVGSWMGEPQKSSKDLGIGHFWCHFWSGFQLIMKHVQPILRNTQLCNQLAGCSTKYSEFPWSTWTVQEMSRLHPLSRANKPVTLPKKDSSPVRNNCRPNNCSRRYVSMCIYIYTYHRYKFCDVLRNV